MKKQHITALAAAALTLASCAGGDNWKLRGSVPAGTAMVVLDEPTVAGGWYAADSVVPDSDGSFSIERPRAKGTIYRLRADGAEIYLPADSTETVGLTLGDDGSVHLTGSVEAALFAAIDSIVAATPDSLVATRLIERLEGQYASLAAYYATRRVDDWRLLRTVTNRHLEEMPGNPRTAVLSSRFETARAARAKAAGETPRRVVIDAPVTDYFDIELMDRNGDMRCLSEVVDSASCAILAFVDFSSGSAPAVHLALGEARNAGAEIFEVGIAENQHLWALASEALPWVNVYQSESASRAHLQQYVVSQLPTFFLFRNGEIVERISDPSKLKI